MDMSRLVEHTRWIPYGRVLVLALVVEPGAMGIAESDAFPT